MSPHPFVVVTHQVHPEVLQYLQSFCVPWINPDLEPLTRDELLKHAADAEAMMVFMTERIDAAFLDRCPKLRIISGALKGYDNFDVDGCTQRGIWFTNVPSLLTEATADLAIALALGISRRIAEGDAVVRDKYSGWRPQLYGAGLTGQIFGVIGLGAVGRALAQRLRGFRCRILYSDKRRLTLSEEEKLGVEFRSLESLLAESDFVAPLVHLTPSTFHLINGASLGLMKRGAILINCGRGSVVDEDAVADYLESGRLGGYGADVFELEDWAREDCPKRIPDRLLADRARTLLTPHLGSAVAAVRKEIELTAARQIELVLRGDRPEHPVAELCSVGVS